METHQDIRSVFQEALDAFVEKVRRDPNILGAILCGSLAYDEVWAKSDIDLLLIGRDEKKPVQDYCLVENGINIHAILYPRSKFKESIERALRSSFFHSLISKSKLLFAADESIREFYRDIHQLGSRDRDMQILKAGAGVLPVLAKAEKWFYVKKDLEYSFFWIMALITGLATIEVLLNNEVTGREVIQQAMKHNPEFFHAVYTDLIHRKKDAEVVQQTLDRVNTYMDEKVHILFRPILEYLEEVGGVRRSSEIDEYFKKRAQTEGLASAYEWLADRDVIQKLSAPLRLSDNSKIEVQEAAYYYDGGNMR
jgi:predicted nucleotidyltransferase